jgi:hypothetical protein
MKNLLMLVKKACDDILEKQVNKQINLDSKEGRDKISADIVNKFGLLYTAEVIHDSALYPIKREEDMK